MNHPASEIESLKDTTLKGKTIVLGVTGSIAAVRCVELARELKRHGADVVAVMTGAAQNIIHPDALHYATGNRVITKLTGETEHVEFCGAGGRADLLLIAPCTANTTGKIAGGIDDTPVTTFVTTAVGSNIPIIIVPAMHESMYRHPLIVDNIRKLKDLGIEFIDPVIQEGAAKIAGTDDIVLHVEHTLGSGILRGRRILITGGATAEPIDPVRIITSRASGKTGIELAKEAYRLGADVTLVHNKSARTHAICNEICEISVETSTEMTEAVMAELKSNYDILISAAAISDFTTDAAPDKIKSGAELTIRLKPARKLIKEVKAAFPDLLIAGFKAETNLTPDELIQRAKQTMDENRLCLIVANDVGLIPMGGDRNEVYIIDRDGNADHVIGIKRDIARAVMSHLAGVFR